MQSQGRKNFLTQPVGMGITSTASIYRSVLSYIVVLKYTRTLIRKKVLSYLYIYCHHFINLGCAEKEIYLQH